MRVKVTMILSGFYKNKIGGRSKSFSISIIAKFLITVLLLTLMYSIHIQTVLATSYNFSSKTILVIHSYNEGFQWTSRQNDGILDKLQNADGMFEIHVEYMDWKNYPEEEEIERFAVRMADKYASKKIDIIITTDDAALEFALNNRAELFSDAPIVFSGVNEKGAEAITKGKTAVTGVIEEMDVTGTVEAALMIKPGIRDIYLLFDNTESGLTTGEIAMEAIHRYNPLIRVIPLNNKRIDEMLHILSNANDDSFVICTTYTASRNGYIMGLEYMSRVLCESSRVPVFHLYELGVGNGAVGGSIVMGRVQGEEAAEKALRVLDDEDISQIHYSKLPTKFVFDYKVLKRFSISMDRLPEGSEVINKPYSHLVKYQNVILTAVIIIVMLLIFITILIFYLKRLHAMRKELSQSNIRLTGLYEDLTVASKKLKKQYDELVIVQNNLNSSEYKLELIFDKMINGFFIFEPVYNSQKRLIDIRILVVTPGFFQNIDMSERDIIGKTWVEVFGRPNSDLGYFENLIETGRTGRFESYDPLKDFYYLVEPFLITENQVGVMFENITEYKKAIREVKRLNTDLEKRVADRTAKLQEAVEELESFSCSVSHDLKSPLRAVDGYVSIMLEDFGENLDSDAVQMLNNISTISRDSIEMINKILQYSKTSRAVLNKERVNVEAKIIKVFDELKHMSPHRDVKLIIETGLPDVFVDRVLFGQMLQNIMSNSLKFTEGIEKAVITVGCTITEDYFAFYIKDNGVGFEMKYSSKLFGLFQRLHTADEFEGTGIGLVTVKKIIEKHGGKVWIESKVDEGTTVYFTVPINSLQSI